MKIVVSTTMGLTIHCAKCHSHKYDPIPHTDYYRLQAIFMSGYRPTEWIPQSAHRLVVSRASADQKPEKIEIRAFWDLPGEVKTHVLRQGNYKVPGPEVAPGVLGVLTDKAHPFKLPPRAQDAKTSGRHLAFAQWLTRPEHPLTAHVFVNRVWLHHFGLGLVATPDNFGKTGSPPSHPELLDWLALEFMDPTFGDRKGEAPRWSIKALHKLIVTSSTYRQMSAYQPAFHAEAKRCDPENRLLWRQHLRRLEAEARRDGVLMAGGSLNLQMFGPPVPVKVSADGEVTTANNAAGNRRSIYLQVRRTQPLTFLQTFDQPVIVTNCTQRDKSTVAGQALTLLNSDFMQRQAEAMAQRSPQRTAQRPGRSGGAAGVRPTCDRTRENIVSRFCGSTNSALHADVSAGQRR